MTIERRVQVDLPRLGVVDPAYVLVVDDDDVLRELITVTLTGAGYEVATAVGGRTAFASIRKRLPDLVVLDVMMPDVSGVDVCRELRGSPRTESLPIIMLTARVHVRQESEGLMAGADLYLPKPFSPRTLLVSVERLLTS